jgi:hypothetical protein
VNYVNQNISDDEITLDDTALNAFERSHSYLPLDHPARLLPPIGITKNSEYNLSFQTY